MRRFTLTIALSSILIASSAAAQVIREATPSVQLSNRDTRTVIAPASTPATLIPFTADPVSTGGDIFDIVSADPKAQVSLVLADGREINSANADTLGFGLAVIPENEFANSQLATLFAFPGTHTVFQLPGSLPSGTYKVKVNTSGISTETLIVATYISTSPVQIGLLTDAHTYRLGDSVVLSGLLFQGSSPVTGATVTARISDPAQPSVSPIEISLTDSGANDAATGDGIYTGTFTTTKAGNFAAAIRATGIASNGTSFSRTTATTFKVLPPLATIGALSDQAIDDDANGLFNRIVITTNVNVQTAGKYLVSMTLMASNGLQAKASAAATLALGTQQIKISFPAQDILNLGVNGPYTEKSVTLIYQDDPDVPAIDFRDPAGNTQAYALSTLERPAIFLTGTNSELGIDTNGNGKFDTLRLQAGVNLRTAGSYQWSASLMDRFGTEIDFTSGSASLAAGNNNITFNFDGRKIGLNGTDGPYSVQGLLIFSVSDSLVVPDAFKTSALSASLFEGFTSSSTLQLSANGYSVSEAAGFANITITRSGVSTGTATVGYVTSNGTAKEGKNYVAAQGVVTFAAGETSKSFPILIIDNAFVEGARTVNITLSNPSGATLAQSTAVLTINDNDSSTGSNPIDQPRSFVEYHYFDFLGRYPDQGGWDFWTNNITGCTPQPSCTEVQRINTSAAYFLSIEFQQTGYLVYKIYKASFGNLTDIPNAPVPIKRQEFLPDTHEIGNGVIVNQGNWQQQLEANKQAFILEFVQRTRFISAFPTTMTPAQFVDKLFSNAGVTPTSADRNAAIAEFGSAVTNADVAARSRALRDVAENATLNTREFNKAFVLMQYFGYLRRNPYDAPEPTLDYSGFNFWLGKLDSFGGNYLAAEMVKAFISSSEYRQRFGP
jgi:hypothetical protein